VVSTADIATFKVFRLEDPNRLVVDLYDTRPARSFAVPGVDSRTVDRIRSSPRQRINYRIVLDLAHRADHRELVLGAVAPHPHRLVIDLFPVVEEGGQASEATPPQRDRDVIVAVDPGHGGKDPGTTGAGRVEEKHIVLAIAREMDRRDSGWKDQRANLVMTLRNRQGQESRRELRISTLEVDGDGDKSLTLFDSPRDVKGTAFLSFTHATEPDDQWLYLPALKRVKRISSRNKSGSFMGSEFAYEDLSSQEVDKFRYKWLRDEALGEEALHMG